MKYFTPDVLSNLNLKQLGSEYGIWSELVNIKHSYPDENETYIVAGLKDLSGENIDPKEIINRNAQRPFLFYPYDFAVKIEEGNTFLALEKLIDYCKDAEFISTIFNEFSASLPEKISVNEVYYLINFNDGRFNPSFTPELQYRYLTGILNYFKAEKKTNGLSKAWRSYCRSEYFDENATKFQNLIGFLKKNEAEPDVKSLLVYDGEKKKLEMQEHEYVKFAEFMKDCYPDICYYAGEKTIVDHGLIDKNDDVKNTNIDTPWGLCITSKKFAEILEKHFADEGFKAIRPYTPSYWEYRDVYYKACDEQTIASVYNSIRLSYAKCNTLSEVKELGELILTNIPLIDFLNFVGFAKDIGLHFYLDNSGKFAKPSFEEIRVVYPEIEQTKMEQVIKRMLQEKLMDSHVIFPEQHLFSPKMSLSDRIYEADTRKAAMNQQEILHNHFEEVEL